MSNNKFCEIDIVKKWNDIKLYTKNNHDFFLNGCLLLLYSPEGFPSASKDKLHKKDRFSLNSKLTFYNKKGKYLNNIKGWSE